MGKKKEDGKGGKKAGGGKKKGAEQFVSFFPHGDFTPSGGHIVYGPFDNLVAATKHASTLSTDPYEGKVATLLPPAASSSGAKPV